MQRRMHIYAHTIGTRALFQCIAPISLPCSDNVLDNDLANDNNSATRNNSERTSTQDHQVSERILET